MKVVFKVKNLYNNRFIVEWEQSFLDGTKNTQTATFRSDDFTLEKFLAHARSRISAQRKILRSDGLIPSNGDRRTNYEWDCDASFLPERLRSQAIAKEAQLQIVDLDSPKQEPEKTTEPQVFELTKRSGVWTIVKHETELLTWEEACNELAKRIA